MEPKEFTVVITNKSRWGNICKRIYNRDPYGQEYVEFMIRLIYDEKDFEEPGAIVDDKITLWASGHYGHVSENSLVEILNYLVLANMDNWGCCIRQLDETGEYEFGREMD